MMKAEETTSVRAAAEKKVVCEHCGEPCDNLSFSIGEKKFCCAGCLTVYRLLKDNGLGDFYKFGGRAGISRRSSRDTSSFAFLDDDALRPKLLDFTDGEISRVTLLLPQIHCSACVWLLEKLHRLEPAILEARVNFIRKRLAVTYRENQLSLRRLAELLASLGYSPQFSLDALDRKKPRVDRGLLLRTGVAGFAFGNIMLLSFPDYLSGLGGMDIEFRNFFGYISLLLALPVFFYSSSVFFRTALGSLRRSQIHLDLPISLGIVALFLRSVYEVVTVSGSGYFDSLAGLVFFLLIGRVVQSRTYQTLAFDRDYRSYFPLHVLRRNSTGQEQVALSALAVGDRLLVRHGELVVADSVLISDSAQIDYSFVTGEAKPVSRRAGDLVYAGGRAVGKLIEVEMVKEVSQSYLTSLWGSERFSKRFDDTTTRLSATVAKYFTAVVLVLAVVTFLLWVGTGVGAGLLASTAVLIVACPCALALTIPFTFGTAMQLLGRNGLYLRDQSVVERLAEVDTIAFDKTGTLTVAAHSGLSFSGEVLSAKQKEWIKSVATNSTHPLSRTISSAWPEVRRQPVSSFQEVSGAGIAGVVEGKEIRLGSRSWLNGFGYGSSNGNGESAPEVWVEIDGCLLGRLEIGLGIRGATEETVTALKEKQELWLISGDNGHDKAAMERLFGAGRTLFRQSPHDKLAFVESLQKTGKKLLMVGDGLNDAGALAASDVGVAVTEETAAFTPASDAILSAVGLHKLPKFLRFGRMSVKIVLAGFVLSFLYNVVGLSFAVTGHLSPLIAAILMPLSSFTVVGFAVTVTRWAALRAGLK